MNKTIKNNIAQLFRFLVGGLFVFSGFVKAVDPMGTAIKLDKYYIAWSEQISEVFLYFTSFSLPLAYFVVSAEVALGVFLLFNFKKEFTLKALLVVIVFFTILTCYTAITGQPTDCGCFGDFMVISPWSSFGKDIVLLVMILFMVKNKKGISPDFDGRIPSLIMLGVTVVIFTFSYYNINHLPVIDFRPYKIGEDITKSVLGKPAQFKYKLTLKTDSTQSVLVEDLTSDLFDKYNYDKQVEVLAEVKPKILEFRIDDELGNEITQKTMTGKTAFIVIRKLEYLNSEKGTLLKGVEEELQMVGIDTYVMSGVNKQTFMSESNYKGFDSKFCSVDEDISKAMIRANLGVVLMENGVVKGKWDLKDIPHGKLDSFYK